MFKIMIVDNEAAIRKGLAHCIRWENLDCIVAAQAEELDQRLELTLGLGIVRRWVVGVGIENHGPKVPRGSRPPTGLLVKM